MATGIYGLSGSGMDVDALVKSSMKAQHMRADALQQKKTQLEWKKTDYNTMYTGINEFRSSTVFNNKLQANLIPKKINSSNESAVTVTANADAANVNHSVSVTQLATGVTETSSDSITVAGNKKETLAEQFGLTGSAATTKFNITINGKELSVDPGQSINVLAKQINDADINVKANYDTTLDRFFIYSTNTGSNAKIDFTGNDGVGADFVTEKLKLGTLKTLDTTGVTTTGKIAMDPTKLTLDKQFSGLSGSFNLKLTNGGVSKMLTIDTAKQSLNDVITSINDAGVNAKASYDSVNGKFTLKAISGTLDFAGSDNAAMDFLSKKLNLRQSSQQGQDAKLMLDGADITQSSNSFTISGITYTLKSAGTSTVNVTSDTDKLVANVKSFVEAYNAQLTKINAKINETKDSKYLPLTPDQKKEMKEDEIKSWETKAKTGLLHNDTILRELTSAMRSDISETISGLTGKYTSASSIGITTGGWQDGGKLYLDETKLNAALQDDPEIVSKILSSHAEGNTRAQNGIAVRLYDTLKLMSDKIVTEAGATAATTSDTKSNVARQIATYTKSISQMNTRMTEMENSYYKKFNAMESALSKFSAQGSWLSQQTKSQ